MAGVRAGWCCRRRQRAGGHAWPDFGPKGAMTRLSSLTSWGSGSVKHPPAAESSTDPGLPQQQMPQQPQQQQPQKASSWRPTMPSAAQARASMAAWTPSMQRPAFMTRSTASQAGAAQGPPAQQGADISSPDDASRLRRWSSQLSAPVQRMGAPVARYIPGLRKPQEAAVPAPAAAAAPAGEATASPGRSHYGRRLSSSICMLTKLQCSCCQLCTVLRPVQAGEAAMAAGATEPAAAGTTAAVEAGAAAPAAIGLPPSVGSGSATPSGSTSGASASAEGYAAGSAGPLKSPLVRFPLLGPVVTMHGLLPVQLDCMPGARHQATLLTTQAPLRS